MKSITKSDRKRLMKRAWCMVKGGHFKAPYLTLSEALKICWKELKDYKEKIRIENEIKIESELTKLRNLWNVKPTINYELQLAYNKGCEII